MIEYPMPGQAPDLFKGFREELANIEKVEQQEQQRALKMASMIEQADQSTMFGGDYSEAQQMAQWMTEHMDDFADSTEGMIEFQQMAQQLTNFIDASEAYKKENVGTAAGGAAQGKWNGVTQRLAGVDPYESKGFRDTRTKEDYEMAYMSLNQGRKLQFDEQGRPMLSQRGRVENPFMPQLEELEFEGGFEWMEANAKGHRFPDGEKDAKAWLERKAQDPKLKRQIARAWKKESTNPKPIEELLDDDTFMEAALQEFYNDALASYKSHSGDPKPEKVDEDQTLLGRFEKLTMGEFTTGDMPGISAEATEGIPPLGPGVPTMEMPQPALDTGFDAFYELRKPISTLSLGEGKKIVGFNVDGFGNMYVVVRQPAQASGDPNAVLDEEAGMEMVTMKVEAGSPLQKTLKRYIDDDIVSALMNLSKSRVQEVSQEDASRERGEQAGAIAGRAASAEKGGLFSRFFGLR
jgi:hypothetical protein